MKLSDYILQPRSARIAHIDLSTPCDPQGANAQYNKQPILDFFNVENDVGNWTTAGVARCHLCECDSTKGWCANPLHVYIGTSSENTLDFRLANPDHPTANGSGPYRHPETSECRLMTREEAEALGWVGATAGKGTFRNPETDECQVMTREEAESLGWVGANAGKATYRNPDTAECRQMTQEEADRLGWVGVAAGIGVYKDPNTGETVRTTTQDAKDRGLVGVHTGRTYTQKVVQCPHCGKEGGSGNMDRYHFDNCDQRAGSWRWFKDQMRQWERSRTKSLIS